MCEQFSRDHIKAAVGKMLLQNGFHTARPTALNVLSDVLIRYLSDLAKLTVNYTYECGSFEPNLGHLNYVFWKFQIDVTELEQHIHEVSGCPSTAVSKYPVQAQDQSKILIQSHDKEDIAGTVSEVVVTQENNDE